jgi:cytoskeletal protein RodZ
MRILLRMVLVAGLGLTLVGSAGGTAHATEPAPSPSPTVGPPSPSPRPSPTPSTGKPKPTSTPTTTATSTPTTTATSTPTTTASSTATPAATTYPLQPVNSGVSSDSRGSVTITQGLLLAFALLVLAALLGGRNALPVEPPRASPRVMPAAAPG